MEANLHPGKTYVDFELGLCCPEGQALRVLAPGESIETPQVHFTLCASGLDALTQSRHRYVRECIMPPNDPIGGCLVEANFQTEKMKKKFCSMWKSRRKPGWSFMS